jgi:choline dehydrogenase-like flavoprotein
LQVIRQAKVYDAVIVGSGAAGGMVALRLARGGAKVLLLEAGKHFDTARDSRMFMWPYELPLRGGRTREHPAGQFIASYGSFSVPGEPYTTARDEEFLWWRSRMLGGRTNHWARISLRFGPYDFKPRSRDGLGFDWPIDYDEIAPYYDQVEALIGVHGSKEGIENAPDGVFLPPPEPRCYEKLVESACDGLQIPCIPVRRAVLTRNHGGRAACHHCGECGRGCTTASNFSTPTVLLPPALATGNLEIRTDAMCREVLSDSEGRATGVAYVDRRTLDEVEVRGKVVVLCASTCESTRLLLNSRSPRFPNGLANSSGVLGKHLMDTVGVGVSALIPSMLDLPPHNEDGTGSLHLYCPWWGYGKKLDFPRGYHIEFGGGRGLPGTGLFWDAHRFMGGGYGKKLKDEYRRHYGARIGFSGRGEMIPNDDCWCEIDPEVVDQWGIPVLRFHWKWGATELLQAKHMRETFHEIIDRLGGKVLLPERPIVDHGIAPGGAIIHEVGTTRMGDDPRTSVLNRYCQSWDVRNLFVTDGGALVSNPDKNPTLTILALSWRAGDYILDQASKLNL